MAARLSNRLFTACLIATAATSALAASDKADAPLHARIDALVAEEAKAKQWAIAQPANDAEFLRRAYLDLAGTIPTTDDARAFLADQAPDKRTRLIDRLLAGDDYPNRLRDLMHVMLMERRGDDEAWLTFLQESFKANKPWDQIAREIIRPNRDDEATRAAAYFYTKRLEKYGQNPIDFPGLTRDVGRMFLGRNLQCAQCHNDLFVEEYTQADFQGLFIAYKNIAIDRQAKFPAVTEGLMKAKVEYVSVFKKVQKAIGPRVPGGEEIAIPTYEKGDEWLVPPDKKKRTPGVPKFSALDEFAKRITSPDNKDFAHNAVNRLWFVMMGRGLVDPLDLHHTDNPPSHPELLDLLADEFIAHKFDVKWLLRELAMSRTYQRASLLPTGVEKAPPTSSFTVALEKRVSAEQLLAATLRATGTTFEKDDDAALVDLRKRFLAALANAPKEPEEQVSPTLKAALFLSNDANVQQLFEPREGNLVDRLNKLKDDAALADELYLSVLTRHPTDEERSELTEYLAARKDRRAAALGQLAWALVASAEFCVNH